MTEEGSIEPPRRARRAVPRRARAASPARGRRAAAARHRRRPPRLARCRRSLGDHPRALHGSLRAARRVPRRTPGHASGDRRLPGGDRRLRARAGGGAGRAARPRAHPPYWNRDGPGGRPDAGRREGALRSPAGVRERCLHDGDSGGLDALVRPGGADRRGLGRLARRAGGLLRLHRPDLRRLDVPHTPGTRAPRDRATPAALGPAPRVGARARVRAPVDRVLRAGRMDARLLPGTWLERTSPPGRCSQ